MRPAAPRRVGRVPVPSRPRVGHIQFLNCLPIYWGLVRSGALLDVELTKDTPDRLNDMLRRRRPGHRPDLARRVPAPRRRPGAAARPRGRLGRAGAVGQPRLPGVRWPSSTAAGSRSGRPRARRCCWPGCGWPRCTAYSPSTSSARRTSARCCWRPTRRCSSATPRCAPPSTHRGGGWIVHDLGAAWRDWTGLPMVFAVWAARRDYAEAQPRPGQGRPRRVRAQPRRGARSASTMVAAQAARWEPFDGRDPGHLLPDPGLLPRRAATGRAARVRPPSRGRRPVAAAAGHDHLRQHLTVQARQSVPR